MSTTDPIVLQFWDHLATCVASVRRTGVGATVSWQENLGTPGRVIKGYPPWPPMVVPSAALYPPKVRSRDGLTMGSFLREATYPVIGFVKGVGQGITESESRVREAYKALHDTQLVIELSRTAAGPFTVPFGGLPVFDCTLSTGEADDLAPFGVQLGVFYFEVVLSYEVTMAQKGM